MNRLLAAFAFLTRVPIGRAFDERDVGRAAICFPLVGAAIGGLQLLAYTYLPLAPLLLAVVVVALSAWTTRALHLDGVADFADGLAGGRSRERVLEIMKDPRIGAFGAVTLVLLMATKIAAIQALRCPAILLVAPALARWAIVPMGTLPYARATGTGRAVAEHTGTVELVGCTLVAGGLFALASPRLVLYAWGSVAVTSLVVATIAWRRIGGVTGDVLGANVELAETSALVVASSLI